MFNKYLSISVSIWELITVMNWIIFWLGMDINELLFILSISSNALLFDPNNGRNKFVLSSFIRRTNNSSNESPNVLSVLLISFFNYIVFYTCGIWMKYLLTTWSFQGNTWLSEFVVSRVTNDLDDIIGNLRGNQSHGLSFSHFRNIADANFAHLETFYDDLVIKKYE